MHESRLDMGQEQSEAYGQLKEHLANPSVLAALRYGEPLYLYFSVSRHVVNSVLFLERDS